MAVELFGVNMSNYAALSVVIAFLITGHRSIFNSQKLSLRKADNIHIDEGNNIENASISINMKDIEKVKNITSSFPYKRFKWEKQKEDEKTDN